MDELVPNTTDAAVEKHIPVITTTASTVTVTVGSVEHPMIEAHFIKWIALQTKEGNQRKTLKLGDEANACFDPRVMKWWRRMPIATCMGCGKNDMMGGIPLRGVAFH